MDEGTEARYSVAPDGKSIIYSLRMNHHQLVDSHSTANGPEFDASFPYEEQALLLSKGFPLSQNDRAHARLYKRTAHLLGLYAQ